jgi:lipopolysaccharide/colanic/teichoic acid biosynthesis glycosyltransferase
MKRLFDVSLLLATAPIWLGTIIITYFLNILFSGFPGFYTSYRHSKLDLPTKVIKFRTMHKNIDKVLNRDTVPEIDTVFLNLPVSKKYYTTIGIKIERFGVTELPQLFLIVTGALSIVGARPLPSNVHRMLNEKYPEIYAKRYKAKCGLTGLPQLVGRDILSDNQRLELEAYYSAWANSNYNPAIDMLIIFYTILIVLKIKNAISYQEAKLILRK